MARSDELEENDDKSTAGGGAQNGAKRYTDLPVTLATTSEKSRSRENDATPFLDSNERCQERRSERSRDDNQSFGAKLWTNVKGIGKAAALVVGLLITTIYIIGSLNRERSLEERQRDAINFKSAGPAVIVTPLDEKPEKTLPPAEPQTAIRLPTKDGKEQVIFVPKRLAEQFSIEAITEIEKNRQSLLAEADRRISESIMPTFDRMSQRARMFVEWYYSSEGEFSFDTALLSSAQENLMSATRSLSLKDAISADMEVFTQQQFAKMVLRPQMTEEEIALSIDETAQALNNMHKLMLAKLQSRFQEIIIRSHEVNTSTFVDININWESLSQRFNGTGFNNSVVFDGAQMAKGAIAGFTIGKITSVIVGKLTKSLGITMTSRLSRAIPYIGMLIPVVIEAYNAYDKEEEKKALLSDLNGVIESIRRDIHVNVVKSVYQPMVDKLISQEMVLKEAMSGS